MANVVYPRSCTGTSCEQQGRLPLHTARADASATRTQLPPAPSQGSPAQPQSHYQLAAQCITCVCGKRAGLHGAHGMEIHVQYVYMSMRCVFVVRCEEEKRNTGGNRVTSELLGSDQWWPVRPLQVPQLLV